MATVSLPSLHFTSCGMKTHKVNSCHFPTLVNFFNLVHSHIALVCNWGFTIRTQIRTIYTERVG